MLRLSPQVTRVISSDTPSVELLQRCCGRVAESLLCAAYAATMLRLSPQVIFSPYAVTNEKGAVVDSFGWL